MFLNILFYSLYLTETQRNDYDIKKQLQKSSKTVIEERFLTHKQNIARGACGYRHAPSQYVSWMRYSPHLFGCHTEPSRKCWMGRS